MTTLWPRKHIFFFYFTNDFHFPDLLQNCPNNPIWPWNLETDPQGLAAKGRDDGRRPLHMRKSKCSLAWMHEKFVLVSTFIVMVKRRLLKLGFRIVPSKDASDTYFFRCRQWIKCIRNTKSGNYNYSGSKLLAIKSSIT